MFRCKIKAKCRGDAHRSQGNGSDCQIDCPGFAIEDLPNVFTPFFSRRSGGFGLGLAISERIVNEHHGKILAGNRSSGGAEVTVLLPGTCDLRPLRILGLGAVDVESGLDRTASTFHSLAVSAEVFAADERIRGTVLKALDHPLTEVALWGEGWPVAVNRGMATVQHVLSAAARTFKGHALAAAGIGCGTVDPTETMFYDMAVCSPADFELIRLG